MDFRQILSDLRKKVYHPLYFLMGEESFFIDSICDFIAEHVLDDSEKEFNQTVLYGKDLDLQAVISQAKRYPMMANHQVVIIKEAQNIQNIENLEAYVKSPLKSTILVVCYKYKTLDKRKAFTKLVDKHGILFESKKLYDNKIPDWINDYLKDKEYIIGPKASLLITEYLGNDLSKISNELNKLMLNIPPKSEISTNHVEQFIGISKDYNNFELQEALGKRDILKANKIVQYFEKNPKENPLVVTIPTLFSYFSKILSYHYCNNKANSKEVASILGVHPFFVKDYEIAAKNYTIRKVVEIIGLLREYDLKSKGIGSATTSNGELLKEFVFKTLH
jgi:DNA polymerase III subunit delta